MSILRFFTKKARLDDLLDCEQDSSLLGETATEPSVDTVMSSDSENNVESEPDSETESATTTTATTTSMNATQSSSSGSKRLLHRMGENLQVAPTQP